MDKIIRVSFTSENISDYQQRDSKKKERYYRYSGAKEVKPDDFIVVSAAPGMAVALAVEVYDDTYENSGISKQAKAWVVDIIDVTSHKERLEVSSRIVWLKEQLEAKRIETDSLAIYEEVVKRDSEAGILLDELKELKGKK